jgi:predicted MFS family arabinose efflux permease
MWMPLQSSMALNLAADGKRGKRLGQTWCVTGLGMVGGMLAVRLVNNALSYPAWFFVGGAWTLAAAAILFFMRRDIGHAQRPRFALNRRYSLYYCLALLEGGRRQVFCTFAVYALTKVYHTPLKTIATLMVINGVVNIFGGPVVGRMIDRTGERRILMFSYFVLIFVFAGYATIKIPQVLYVLYCLDNLLFLSTTCLTTYVQRIGKPEDLTTTLSTGVTAGHIAAVLVPLVGGYLWASLGYPATFFGGAGLVIMSLFLAARVPPLKLKQAREVE